MPARSATSRKWRAAAVHAARAAAFLSIATGVNSVLTAMYPRYEPVYAYLVAVLVVAWMSSALLGVTTAVAAAILYDWMFAPVRVVPSMSFAIPLTIAVAIAIATRAARLPLERPMLAEAVQPPALLPPVARPAPVELVVDDTQIRELEQKIEELERLRGEEKSTAESHEAQLVKQIDTLRQSVTELKGRLDASRRESDAMAERATEAEARTKSVRQELEEQKRLRNEETSAADSRQAQLTTQIDALRQSVTEADSRTSSARQELEPARREIEKQKRVRAEEKAAAGSREAQLAAEVNALRKYGAELNGRVAAAQRQIEEQTARTTREVKAREELEVAAHASLQKAITDLSAKYETALAESKTRSDALQRTLAEATAKHEKATAGAQKQTEAAVTKMQALQTELDRTLASLTGEHARADREAMLRSQLEMAARETLQRTADVAAAHQREASEAREKAQAADERASALQRELAEAKRAVEQETLRVTFESAARQKAADEAASARHDTEALREELSSARDAMASERERMNLEFDAKLQKIVSGLASDHEHAIGDAILEREAARAELRLATQRVQELERAVQEERQRATGEQTARERLDAQWNDKLQKIVAHLTEDHESDVGEAMLQREAARAEVRTLTARLAAAQKQIEDERGKFRQMAERWQRRTAEQPVPAAPERSRPAVVLVVHSDAGVRAMARHSLQQAGYDVITAADGLEGLRTASQQKPDVVVAEPVMPKMNARELVQLLKSRRETAGMKIVLLSGKGDQDAGADYRADDVVRNPGDFNELRTTLANVLAHGGTGIR